MNIIFERLSSVSSRRWQIETAAKSERLKMQIDASKMSMMEFYRTFWRIVKSDLSVSFRILVVLFFVITAYYLAFGRGRARRLLGVQTLLIIAVLFNPAVMYGACRLLSMSDRYFRYMWLFPIPFVCAYFVSSGTETEKSDKTGRAGKSVLSVKSRNILAVTAAAFFLLWGSVCVVSSTSRLYDLDDNRTTPALVSNVYKVETDTLQIATIIEEDKKDPNKTAHALYGYYTFLDLRTYDPSIWCGFTLKDQSGYNGKSYDDRDLLELYEEGDTWHFLDLLINGNPVSGEISVDSMIVLDSLRKEDFEYIIVRNTNPAINLFVKCGDVLGASNHFTVIKLK